MDSSNSDTDDFEGFVVSPEEKESYKVWARKRRTSEALDSDSDEDASGDDDDNDDEEEEENSFGDEELEGILCCTVSHIREYSSCMFGRSKLSQCISIYTYQNKFQYVRCGLGRGLYSPLPPRTPRAYGKMLKCN